MDEVTDDLEGKSLEYIRKVMAESEKAWHEKLKAQLDRDYPNRKPLTPEQRNADLIDDDNEDNVYEDED